MWNLYPEFVRTLYEEEGLRLVSCACYWWEMDLIVVLNELFNNMWDWKVMREKAGESNESIFIEFSTDIILVCIPFGYIK
jgi:hypothetical protein